MATEKLEISSKPALPRGSMSKSNTRRSELVVERPANMDPERPHALVVVVPKKRE